MKWYDGKVAYFSYKQKLHILIKYMNIWISTLKSMQYFFTYVKIMAKICLKF